jgi:hypothetical protein
MRKILKYISVLILVGVFTFLFTNFKNLKAFPYIISSYYSKEFCSCYFITNRTTEFCHNYTKQYIPISSFKLDEEKKEVIVSGLGIESKAKFNSEFGCLVE